MRHPCSFLPHRPLLAVFLALSLWAGQPKMLTAQSTSPSLDLFSGVDFNFRDINFNTQYEFLIRLSPGFKWDMGHHWQLAGQVMIPIVNQYGDGTRYVQLNMLNVSKELQLGQLYLKGTAGLFSEVLTQNRYGLDLKAFWPLCDWFAFEGQAGWVGIVIMNPDWFISSMDRYAWTAGADVYLSKWNTQLRFSGGKYLYQDYGYEIEAMRHFNHTTVSVYGLWNNVNYFDAGFRVVIALPPYHRKHRTVNFRPASNWRMSYTTMYHIFTNRMYCTDPEENERDGWFSRDLLQWGSHTMQPDFIYKTTNTNETP